MGLTIQEFTTAGLTQWPCPSAIWVNSVNVELWGGGGTGGGVTGANSTGGGGAGGQYAMSTNVQVFLGNTYGVNVAAGSTGSSTTTANGLDSNFAATLVVAKGGAGANLVTTINTAGTRGQGSTTGGVGMTVYAGGFGANAISNSNSGGGGGGAGSTGAGANATNNMKGGNTVVWGGGGGNGIVTAGVGLAALASNYGGGGGGAFRAAATNRAGGNGRQGAAKITYQRYDRISCCGVGV